MMRAISPTTWLDTCKQCNQAVDAWTDKLADTLNTEEALVKAHIEIKQLLNDYAGQKEIVKAKAKKKASAIIPAKECGIY